MNRTTTALACLLALSIAFTLTNGLRSATALPPTFPSSGSISDGFVVQNSGNEEIVLTVPLGWRLELTDFHITRVVDGQFTIDELFVRRAGGDEISLGRNFSLQTGFVLKGGDSLIASTLSPFSNGASAIWCGELSR